MSGPTVIGIAAAVVAVWILVGSPRAERRRVEGSPPRRGAVVVWSRGRLVAATASGSVGWLLAGLVGSGVSAAVAPACAALGWWWFGRLEPQIVRRQRVAEADDLPITLDMVAACLEAGAPLRAAVRQVADLAPVGTSGTLARLDVAVRLGVDEPAAWSALVDDPVWGAAARDVVRSLQTGVPAREVLREHAAEARAAGHNARLARARAVGVWSALPLMVCFLPAFLLLGVVPIVAGLIPRMP